MRKMRNVILISGVLAVGTLGAGSLLAQGEEQQEGTRDDGMHKNMMEDGDMMEQMSSMMEKCNAMMEKMQESQETDGNA